MLTHVPVEGRWDWNWIRVNSPMSQPSYADMFEKWLPSVSKKKSRKEDSLSLVERAMESENTFWEKDHEYDGQVRGALGENTLLLVIPGSYTCFGTDSKLATHFAGLAQLPRRSIHTKCLQQQPNATRALQSIARKQAARMASRRFRASRRRKSK